MLIRTCMIAWVTTYRFMGSVLLCKGSKCKENASPAVNICFYLWFVFIFYLFSFGCNSIANRKWNSVFFGRLHINHVHCAHSIPSSEKACFSRIIQFSLEPIACLIPKTGQRNIYIKHIRFDFLSNDPSSLICLICCLCVCDGFYVCRTKD